MSDPRHDRPTPVSSNSDAPADVTPIQVMTGSKSAIFWAGVVFIAGVALFAVIQVDSWGERANRLPSRFSLDTSELTSVDAAQVAYKEIAAYPVEMETLRAVAAIPDGGFAVVGDVEIQRFDESGRKTQQITTDSPPTCIAFALDANLIYVGFAAAVHCYDAGGERRAVFNEGLNEDSMITSLAVFEDNVFVADAGQRAVLKFDSEGELLLKIDEEKKVEQGLRSFVVPSAHFDVLAADDGVLRVVNPGARSIEAFTLEGDALGAWGETSSAIEGFFGCCNPVALSMLPDGRFVTAEKGIPRVKIYDSNGTFESIVAPPAAFTNESTAKIEIRDSQRNGVLDVAVDRDGRILVLDPNRQTIRVFIENSHE
ncbi:hypothetical protein Q31b_46750 [Novipirellula aureliae]|uniref:NHL repeat protein n=2 Tax=Novipirellula aureliae TaxID=2527966 RepID=A0A5C6DS63_9BACT|nr:hypothetical protein Q31b_46750 [Novipirellula aureliae]